MNRMPYLWVALLIGAFVSSRAALKTARAAEDRLNGAVLILDDSPLGALLEAELLKLDEFRWVERSEIAKVLAEQRLQALLSPEAGALRRKVGSLIKADRLVMLRSREIEKQTFLELGVAESAQGIRLLSRLVPLKGQQEGALASALAEQIRARMRKQDPEIRAILAVPSFVSKDLGFEHDRLQAAYAALVQQRLLEQPGVVVVEIAEAEALARERTLGGEEAKERPAPAIVLGEYRNTGRDAERRIALSLSLRQGANEIASVRAEIRPQEASTVLSTHAEKFLERVSGSKLPPADPKAEALQLIARAKEFEKVAQWEEAFPLLRAALLIDPENQELRLNTIRIAAKLFGRYPVSSSGMSLVGAQDAFFFCFVALDEGEQYVQRGGNPAVLHSELIRMQPMFPQRDARADVREFVTICMNRRRSFAEKMGRQLLEKKHYAAMAFLQDSFAGLSGEDRFARRLQLMEEFHDRPDNDQLLRGLATASSGVGELMVVKGGEHFVDQLTNSKYAKLQALGRKLAAEVVAEKEKMGREQADSSGPTVPLQPLPIFDWYDENGMKGKLGHPEFMGPVLPDADIVTFGPAIYVMREPGRLKRLWSIPDRKAFIARWSASAGAALCYDGRYLWARLLHESETARLLVIDMTTEKAFIIDPSHGLPTERRQQASGLNSGESMCLAPLAPGKVCACGSIGGGTPRTWIAMVTYDPSQGPSVELIHEARETRDPKQRDQWRKTELAFVPNMVFLLKDKDSADQRVLAPREAAVDGFRYYPLVVNPRARTVEVMPVGLSMAFLRSGVPYDQHNPLFVDGDPQTNEVRLCRVTFPAKNVEVVSKIPREGYPLIHNGRLHVAGKQWWAGSLSGDDLQPMGECPWGYVNMRSHLSENRSYGRPLALHYLTTSHHYGIVALYSSEGKLQLSRIALEK